MRASKKGSKKIPSPASINNTMRKIDASWSLEKAIRINLVFLKIGKLLATVLQPAAHLFFISYIICAKFLFHRFFFKGNVPKVCDQEKE